MTRARTRARRRSSRVRRAPCGVALCRLRHMLAISPAAAFTSTRDCTTSCSPAQNSKKNCTPASEASHHVAAGQREGQRPRVSSACFSLAPTTRTARAPGYIHPAHGALCTRTRPHIPGTVCTVHARAHCRGHAARSGRRPCARAHSPHSSSSKGRACERLQGAATVVSVDERSLPEAVDHCGIHSVVSSDFCRMSFVVRLHATKPLQISEWMPQ